ncbi:MAG: sensor domain-containing phosphodiesterase [Eubacterium sp.]
MKSKAKIMNALDDMIYVCDLETYALLYVSEKGKQLLEMNEVETCEGKKCYETIQGLSEPCDFCKNDLLSEDKFYFWEYTSKRFKRHYLVRDKLINWKGRKAKLEFAMDITDKEIVSRAVSSKIEVEETLVGCIKKLVSSDDLEEALRETLEIIATFYGAERAYICEFLEDQKNAKITYEWHKKQLKARGVNVKTIPRMHISDYIKIEENEEYFICDDVEKIKKDYPDAYEAFRKNGVFNMIGMSFDTGGDYAGYIGINNYTQTHRDIELLRALSYFMANEIIKRRSRDQLKAMLKRDPLTGLLNRYSYLKDIKKISKETLTSIGIVFVDINGLKEVNDVYGHEYGDKVIANTGKHLGEFFEGESVYRLSGDEFVVICKNSDRLSFAEKIKKARLFFDKENSESVAMGYTWEDEEFDIPTLIRHADERMYLNKQVYYRDSFEKIKHHRPRMLQDLLSGLEKNEFEMYLQPKASVDTGKIIGAEALVRRNDPERGVIFPGEFIPLLEKEGSVQYIDFFILEEVCKTLENWQKKGDPLIVVSLNFSRITMMEPNLIDRIKGIYNHYTFPKKFIEIEITETAGDMEREAIASVIMILKKEGFRISLDDFGTKYTSMAMLTLMDLDEIKLDRSLISSLSKNDKNRILVRHIINLCKDMNLHAIAEGVETEEQLAILKEMNCDAIQGYILSKPIPLKTFEKQFRL